MSESNRLIKMSIAAVDAIDYANPNDLKTASTFLAQMGRDYQTRASRRVLYRKMATMLRRAAK